MHAAIEAMPASGKRLSPFLHSYQRMALWLTTKPTSTSWEVQKGETMTGTKTLIYSVA